MDYKSLVESLSDPDIKKSDYDQAIKLIHKRVNEIWRYICKASERTLGWWAFENDVELGRGQGSTGGYFDPRTDIPFITLKGQFHLFYTTIGNEETSENSYYPYQEGFPTELLWDENYQATVDGVIKYAIDELTKERLAKLEKNKEKRQRKQENEKNKEILLNNINEKTQSVLTTEEYNLMLSRLFN